MKPSNTPTLPYMELLMSGFDQPTFMLFSHLARHFDGAGSCNNGKLGLSHWMTAMCCYPYSWSDKLLDLFLQYGVQLARSGGMASAEAGQTVRFAKLVAHRGFHPEFLFTVMDRTPYAKDAFLLYLQQCPLEERVKIPILSDVVLRELLIEFASGFFVSLGHFSRSRYSPV